MELIVVHDDVGGVGVGGAGGGSGQRSTSVSGTSHRLLERDGRDRLGQSPDELAAGVLQVAEWAGHSVEVLLGIYAKCLDGTQDAAQRRIEETLDPAPEHGTGGRHNGSESNAPTSDDEAE